MTPLVQAIAVAAIVAVATLYAALRFMPKTWRSMLAAGAGRWAVRFGLSDLAARRVEAKLATGGACGSCDSCRACATPVESAAPLSSASAYRTIPIRRAQH